MLKHKKKFLNDISNILGPIPAKEALLAVLGYKTSRLGIHPNYLQIIVKIFEFYNVQYVIGNFRYTYIKDIGKGGWSNRFGDETLKDDTNAKGDFFFYIADNLKKAKAALEKEENEKEFEFGETLGIPSCCANFYIDNAEKAFKKQNDFVLYVLEKTKSNPPYDFWNNYVSQYFGYSLLSFFPCSFDCESSKKVSKQIFKILNETDHSLANKFLFFHKQNILYTEYRGIYLFENSIFRSGSISYKNTKIHSTMNKSSIQKTIFQGDKIKIINKNYCLFYNKNKLIRELKGENIALCLFK